MQWLAAVCVRRPVFTWVLMLTLVVIGAASLTDLGIDRFPNVEFPMVTVITALPGASAEQVESEVTDKIEEGVNSIAGVDELRSLSAEGISLVFARFDLDKDANVAAQEVRDRVNRVLPQLPRDITQPQIERVTPDAAPVMMIALSGPRSTRELTEYANRTVRRQLQSVAGVGEVRVFGGRDRQIDLVVDPARLQNYGLTIVDVQRAAAAQNIEIPGGLVTQGARTLQLRVQGRVESVEAFNDLAIAQRGGLTVRLRDVGRAVDAETDASSAATLNGREVVVVAVRKQSGVNAVELVDRLRERVEEIQRAAPRGLQMRVVRDESEFIRNAIGAVEEHLVLGALLASLVVLIFLWNGRSTLISALAIPTSIIATFALIRAMGLTLNTITLLALTLAVGIVIDDAIVVLENIFRFIDERGMPPRRAAIVATREIGLAVLATTLSLVAVFLPIAFMGGIVGRFMKSFGYTMSFAIMVSLLVSFTLTPMLAARWLKPRRGRRAADGRGDGAHAEAETALDAERVDPPPGPRAEERAELAEWLRGTRLLPPEFAGEHARARGVYGLLERGYVRLLAFVMRHRWLVGLAMLAALGSTVPLGAAVNKNFLPIDDESRFEVSVHAPEGTSLEQTRVLADRMARDVRALPGVSHTLVTVGSLTGGRNDASIFVALVDPTRRQLSQEDLMQRVRTAIAPRYRDEHLRVLVSPVNIFGGGGVDAAAIHFVIRGPDLRLLERYARQLLERVRRIPGVVDADTTAMEPRPEYVVRIDRARAADLGVSVADVAVALRMMVAGVRATDYAERGEQYEVHVRAAEEFRTTAAELERVTVPAGFGRSVRLADVVTIHEGTGPTSIAHVARQRQVTVYCNVTQDASEAAVISQIEAAMAQIPTEPGYTAELAGQSKELGRANRSFALAFGLSLAFMYLVLAAQFESWIHPITILISLPLTVPFALLSLIFLRQSMNIFSTLGILVLFGVVKKNSILQVDHMRDLRRRGLSRADAVMLGNRDRLRPILMTTVAFVAGMIPLVVSTGAGAGTNQAMASVIIGGQSLSLLLTLLATPVVFTWFDDLAHSRLARALGAVLTFPFRLLNRIFEGRSEEPEDDDPPR